MSRLKINEKRMAKIWLCRLISSLFLGVFAVTKGVQASLCHKGNYGVQTSSGITCYNCSTIPNCPPGMGMNVHCGDVLPEDANMHCVRCFPGRNYSLTFDNSVCQPCTTCQPNEAFNGECIPAGDSIQCKGVCKKGYYSKTGSANDCEPCATCHSPKATPVPKCVADKEPRDRQCEAQTASAPIVPTEQVITEGKGTEDKEKMKSVIINHNNGFEAYGSPFLFAAFVVTIVILFVCLVWQKKYCRRKKLTNQSQNSNAQEVRLDPVQRSHDLDVNLGKSDNETIIELGPNTEAPITLDVVNENELTDHFDRTAVEPGPPTRRNSNSGRRRVSFTQHNSVSASEEIEETLVMNQPADDPENDNVFAEQVDKALSVSTIRKRTLSFSSEGKKGPRLSISRQNSNPGSASENQNEESHIRKSRTFSGFSSLIPGLKGTAEEKEPILSFDENANDSPLSINMKPSVPDYKTKKPSELNANVYSEVCRKLNDELKGKDWEALAGRMDYTNDIVKRLKREKNPAEALLSSWQTEKGNNVGKLIEFLEYMGRSDIIELIQ